MAKGSEKDGAPMFWSSHQPGKQSLYCTRLLTPGLSLKGLICNKQMAIVYLAKNKNKIRRFYGSCYYKVLALQSVLLRTTAPRHSLIIKMSVALKNHIYS